MVRGGRGGFADDIPEFEEFSDDEFGIYGIGIFVGFVDQRESTDTTRGALKLARLLFFVWRRDSVRLLWGYNRATQDSTIEEGFLTSFGMTGVAVCLSGWRFFWKAALSGGQRKIQRSKRDSSRLVRAMEKSPHCVPFEALGKWNDGAAAILAHGQKLRWALGKASPLKG
jgi:hypothetical protein